MVGKSGKLKGRRLTWPFVLARYGTVGILFKVSLASPVQQGKVFLIVPCAHFFECITGIMAEWTIRAIWSLSGRWVGVWVPMIFVNLSICRFVDLREMYDVFCTTIVNCGSKYSVIFCFDFFNNPLVVYRPFSLQKVPQSGVVLLIETFVWCMCTISVNHITTWIPAFALCREAVNFKC